MNFLISMATMNVNVPDKWAPHNLISSFMVATNLSWISRISNVVVGILMARGKSSAWIPVLAILGFTIAKNFITFKYDYGVNHFQTIASLAVNVLLFLLVFQAEYHANKELDQRLQAVRAGKKNTAAGPHVPTANEATKSKTSLTTSQQTVSTAQRTQPKVVPTMKVQPTIPAKPRLRHVEFVVKRGMPIVFDGHGKIAEVIHCTDQELWLKPTNHLPRDIHKRTVTLQDPAHKGKVRLKFSGLREDSVIVFRLIG
ncbi:MAG TPA: hypothetical protein VF412_03800 [Bdellovibrio sp.]|uniref:hypothetical protein n=1 Tax=Bdellovibrio sp. TaxID=28201 RepID=UPI002F0F4772